MLDLPVISFGCSSPIAASKVGATSPRTPSSFFRLQPSGAFAMTKGTLLVVCDVFGVPPSSISISSALLRLLASSYRSGAGIITPMIRGHEQNVSLLLARLKDLTNLFVCGRYPFDGSLVDTCMPHHIGRRKVVHQEPEFAL